MAVRNLNHLTGHDLQRTDVDAFQTELDGATSEGEMQRYLEGHPLLLVQHQGGGHGRWVIPKAKLGTQHETDFLIADRDSTGRRWVAVELEHPTVRMFTKKGDPTKELTHGLRQVLDWRAWLVENRDYAVKPRDRNGLGLEDIDPALPGLIVIGRRSTVEDSTRARRRELMKSNNTEIHTFDWLIERARGRVEALDRYHQQTQS